MHNVVGATLIDLREFVEALVHLEQAAATLGRLGDPVGEANAAMNIALANLRLGRTAAAMVAGRRALRLAKAGGQRWQVARALNNLGEISREAGEVRRAFGYLEAALRMRRHQQDVLGEALTLEGIGTAHLDAGRPKLALEYFEQALCLDDHIGHHENAAGLALQIGRAHLASGDRASAVHWVRRAGRDLAAVGEHHHAAIAWRTLAEVLLADGDRPGARRALDRAREIRHHLPDPVEQRLIDPLVAALSQEGSSTHAAG